MDPMKQRLAVLFGGITVEHEVSVITAVQLMKEAVAKYDVVPVYVDKIGHWWTGQQLFSMEYFKTQNLLAPTGLEPFLISPNPNSNEIDVAILCFHGQYGESGKIQGVLDAAAIPYQGPGVTSSALCFDKIHLRQILTAEGVSQPNYVWFTLEDWQTDAAAQLEQVTTKLSFPVFVKPANGGSTVGIEKVDSETELAAAVERVLHFDTRILIESAVVDCLEVNVSVLGFGSDITTSVPEQPMTQGEFLSFADKYERGGKKSGMASATRRIPAPISAASTQRLQSVAKQVFRVLGCSGVIRIDFFINPSTNEYFVIEPNTIPGSMSYYLWEASGVTYPELIDRLVEIAFERAKQAALLTQSYDTNILSQAQE